jgi:RIO kinase 1
MQLLHKAGGRVPKPLAISGHALVMEFIGDADGPAPKLRHCALSPTEARTMHTQLMDEITLWLANDRIHGDLSPFNVLVDAGRPVVIDFPQAVNPWDNPDSPYLLERDIHNISAHFGAYGISVDASRLARDLWRKFQYGAL